MALRISKDTRIPEDIIYFESDEEFTDFCLAPYAVVRETAKGNLVVEGQYSDLYKKYVEEGKTFIIKDENSQVYKRLCVSKRVPIKVEGFPDYNRSTLVQLPVENLEEWER